MVKGRFSEMEKVEKVEKVPVVLDFNFNDIEKLSKFPWEIDSDSIDEFKCVDVFCFIKASSRPLFMDELYRILVIGGKGNIVVPYYSTSLAFADYAIEWPPLVEQSFLYFNKEWREANNLKDRPIKCDFDFTYGYVLTPEVAVRAQEVQTMHVKSYWNTVQRLQVTMIKPEKVTVLKNRLQGK